MKKQVKGKALPYEEHNRRWMRRSVQQFSGGFDVCRANGKPSNLERSMPLKRLSDDEFRMLVLAGYRVVSRRYPVHYFI